MWQEALDFGAIEKGAVVGCLAVVEWLNAKHIARQEKAFFLGIPNSKGKHPAHLIEDAFLPFCIAVNEHLAVGVGLKMIALLFKLCANFLKVVNFTVKGQGVTTSFVKKWLVAIIC